MLKCPRGLKDVSGGLKKFSRDSGDSGSPMGASSESRGLPGVLRVTLGFKRASGVPRVLKDVSWGHRNIPGSLTGVSGNSGGLRSDLRVS